MRKEKARERESEDHPRFFLLLFFLLPRARPPSSVCVYFYMRCLVSVGRSFDPNENPWRSQTSGDARESVGRQCVNKIPMKFAIHLLRRFQCIFFSFDAFTCIRLHESSVPNGHDSPNMTQKRWVRNVRTIVQGNVRSFPSTISVYLRGKELFSQWMKIPRLIWT